MKHHLLPAATVLGLVGLAGLVTLTINENNASLYQTYFALITLLVPSLVVIGQWWRNRHQKVREQPPPPSGSQPPPPTAVPVVPPPIEQVLPIEQVTQAWLTRLLRRAIHPATVIVAASVGLGVDIAMSLLGSAPRQAALTAVGTALAAYVVYLVVMTATDRGTGDNDRG